MIRNVKLEEGFTRSLYKYTTEQLFEADIAAVDDDWEIINPENEVKLIAQDPNYELYQVLGPTGFMMLADGTSWLKSYDYDSNSYVDSDIENSWRLQRHNPEDFYVILDKHNPKKKYLITKGDAQLISPSGAYYPAATWLSKHCEPSVYSYFIKNRFPYLTTNLDKKVGALQYQDKTVYKYPEDKGMTWENKGGSAITRIEIEQGTKSINSRSFGNLTKVQQVTIPNTIKKLGSYLFVNCEGLKKVNLPNTLKEIPEGCFSNCKSLEEITIPEGVEKLGKYAFNSCTSLKKVYLPSTLKIIGEEAFCFCESLENIVLPDGLEEIGWMAFLNCDLKHIFIPESVQKVGEKAFLRNNDIHIDIEIEGTEAQKRWGMKWLIKDVEWNRNTYRDNTTFFDPSTHVTFNANRRTVTEEVEQGNLLDDDSFEVIDLPKPLFENDVWVVYQPNTLGELYSLSEGTGWDIENLIGEGEYSYQNWGLKHKLENNLNTQLYVFNNKTTDNKYLYTPSNDFMLNGHRAFIFKNSGEEWRPADDNGWHYYRYGSQILDKFLRMVNNNGLSRWASRKWSGLDSLKTDLKAQDIAENNNYTLEYKSEFYDNIRHYDTFSVAAKKYFKYIRFPRNITTIEDYAFYEFKGLEEVVIPNSVKEIKSGAFCFCSGLKSIKLPKNLEKIGENAFNGCTSLTSIIIPKSVTYIGEEAFRYDYNITVYCEAEEKPEGWSDNWDRQGNSDTRITNIVWGYKE